MLDCSKLNLLCSKFVLKHSSQYTAFFHNLLYTYSIICLLLHTLPNVTHYNCYSHFRSLETCPSRSCFFSALNSGFPFLDPFCSLDLLWQPFTLFTWNWDTQTFCFLTKRKFQNLFLIRLLPLSSTSILLISGIKVLVLQVHYYCF